MARACVAARRRAPLARAFGGIAFLPAFHILRGQEGNGEMGLARFPGFQTQPQAQRGAGSERAAQRTGQCARGRAFAAFKARAIRLPCHFSAQRQRGEGVGTAPRPARPARKDERALRRARGGNEEILKGGVRQQSSRAQRATGKESVSSTSRAAGAPFFRRGLRKSVPSSGDSVAARVMSMPERELSYCAHPASKRARP